MLDSRQPIPLNFRLSNMKESCISSTVNKRSNVYWCAFMTCGHLGAEYFVAIRGRTSRLSEWLQWFVRQSIFVTVCSDSLFRNFSLTVPIRTHNEWNLVIVELVLKVYRIRRVIDDADPEPELKRCMCRYETNVALAIPADAHEWEKSKREWKKWSTSNQVGGNNRLRTIFRSSAASRTPEGVNNAGAAREARNIELPSRYEIKDL